MSIFNGLGRALRWLRDRQGKRQYQVADAAGITKAMLSAYETGKQKPSLDTLEKILVALECDLNDLHNCPPDRQRAAGSDPPSWRAPGYLADLPPGGRRRTPADASGNNVYRVLGLKRQLPALEEQALSEMLEGFHKLVRYLHGMIARRRPRESEPDEEPS